MALGWNPALSCGATWASRKRLVWASRAWRVNVCSSVVGFPSCPRFRSCEGPGAQARGQSR